MRQKILLIIMFVTLITTGCSATKNAENLSTKNNESGDIDLERINEPWKITMISAIENYLNENSDIYPMDTTFTITDIDNSGIPEVIINTEFQHTIVTYNGGEPSYETIYWPVLEYEKKHSRFAYVGAESGCRACILYKVENDFLILESRIISYFEDQLDKNGMWVNGEDVAWEINGEEVSKEEYETCLKESYNEESVISVYDMALPTLTKAERLITEFEMHDLTYQKVHFEVEEWKKIYKEEIEKFLRENNTGMFGTETITYVVNDLDKSGFPEIVLCKDYTHYYVFTYNKNNVSYEEFHCDSLSYDENNGWIVTSNSNMGNSNTAYYKVEDDKLIFDSSTTCYLKNENMSDFEDSEYYDTWEINGVEVTQEEYEAYRNTKVTNMSCDPNCINSKYLLVDVIDEF